MKHLATANLFRHPDNSIHVTFAEANGVKAELGDSGAPLHLCAMNALRAAKELPIQVTSEGAFRLGAAAMRDAAKVAARHALCAIEWPPQDGDAQIDAVLARIDDLPLPDMPEPRKPKNDGSWGWWAGRYEELFDYGGPSRTRECAIADGRDNDDGEGFYIVEAQTKSYRFCAESIIDCMLENSEAVYDDYAEMCGPKDECDAATAELQALLDAWMARHEALFTPATAFEGTRNLEFIKGVCPDCEAEHEGDCQADEVDEAA